MNDDMPCFLEIWRIIFNKELSITYLSHDFRITKFYCGCIILAYVIIRLWMCPKFEIKILEECELSKQ